MGFFLLLQDGHTDFLEQLIPFSRLFACLASTCEDVRMRVSVDYFSTPLCLHSLLPVQLLHISDWRALNDQVAYSNAHYTPIPECQHYSRLP